MIINTGIDRASERSVTPQVVVQATVVVPIDDDPLSCQIMELVNRGQFEEESDDQALRFTGRLTTEAGLVDVQIVLAYNLRDFDFSNELHPAVITSMAYAAPLGQTNLIRLPVNVITADAIESIVRRAAVSSIKSMQTEDAGNAPVSAPASPAEWTRNGPPMM